MSQLPIQPDQNPYGHQEENPYVSEGSLPYIDYSKENLVSRTTRTGVPSAPAQQPSRAPQQASQRPQQPRQPLAPAQPKRPSPMNQRQRTDGCGCVILCIVGIIIAIIANLVSHSSSQTADRTVDLLTALNQQLVTVSFTNTGGASGNVIDITLHRFKSQNSDIHVTMPPGLLLTNSDPSEQNMILEDPLVQKWICLPRILQPLWTMY